MDRKRYYYLGCSHGSNRIYHSGKGHFFGGHALGILVMNISYPKLPGNVANATTYKYPICYKVLNFDDPMTLLSGDKKLLDEIIRKGKELVEEGVRAIVCACGYFGHFQNELSEAFDVPVYTSSLLQIPLIKIGLKPKQRIGLICANKKHLTLELLQSIGVPNSDMLVIEGMDGKEEFNRIQYNKQSFNNTKLCREIVETAVRMVKDYPDIGAILLECSDLPPYSVFVQNAVSLPVFDFITMINWVHHSICQKAYYGFI